MGQKFFLSQYESRDSNADECDYWFGLFDFAHRPGHQAARYLNKIHDAGNALLGIVNSILDFSKLKAGRWRSTLARSRSMM